MDFTNPHHLNICLYYGNNGRDRDGIIDRKLELWPTLLRQVQWHGYANTLSHSLFSTRNENDADRLFVWYTLGTAEKRRLKPKIDNMDSDIAIGEEGRAQVKPEPDELEISMAIAICTRGRGAKIVDTIESILASSADFNELIIVDQSINGTTEEAIQPYLSDVRLHYKRTDTVGIGVSRNLAIDLSDSEFLVFVDDDCVVDPGWTVPHLHAFLRHPQVAMTFGTVAAADYDHSKGFIPAYNPTMDHYVRSFRDKRVARGIGANAALRRKIIKSIGGYDPVMGTGGRFFGNEDGDLAIRCLLSGYEIYECKDSVTLHFGFRDWASGRRGAKNDFVGIGAAYVKPFKCGRWDGWHVLYEEGVNRALMPFLSNLIRLRPPFGWARVIGFAQGVALGWITPIDPETLHFVVDQDKS